MALYIKAFTLVVKTASKPLARRLRTAIEESPTARAYAIESARATAKWMAFLARDDAATSAASGEPGHSSRKARNEAKRAMARANMSEDAALQAASEFAGEAFVFAVAGGAVWWEVEKSNAKDEKRREDAANERAQLCDIIDTQHKTMVDMSALIEELFEYKKSSSETIAAMQAGRRVAAR